MAEIMPFHGVRFAARGGRALGDLLAPPYELISPEERAELLARSPYNVEHLSVRETRREVAPGRTLAAELWSRWLEERVLQRDPSPGFYAVEQTFGAPDGRAVRRRGFLAAVRLHDLAEGMIIPHERTHPATCADRLDLLRATRVNLSAPLGLFADERGRADAALAEAMSEPPVADAEREEDRVRLWHVERAETMARLASLVEDQRILLADGHHRYLTALDYQREVDAAHPGLPLAGGHRYVLMMLCSLSDPGLVVYPVHRLLSGLQGFSLGWLLERLGPFFTIDPLEEDLRRPAGRAWAIARLAEHASRSTAFLMISAEDRRARILTLRDDADLDAGGMPCGETVRMIDVNVLHCLVLHHLLGIGLEAQERGEHLVYARDAQEAVARVLSGEHALGFLVNPAPMWQVKVLAEAGETMPPRTTLFRPALPAGLVMREVRPEGPP